MKGIILAGGSGTRLYPLTKISTKQLLPVYDKPMIYYPLSTLMLAGVKDIALVSTPSDLSKYENLLGDGADFGINISYFEQAKPRGIAEAFLICKEFINDNNVALILGDNIFHGNLRLKELFENFSRGAHVYGYPVKNPEKYGVVEFDSEGRLINIVEKPENPPSNYIIPGLYLYDNTVVERTSSLSPSGRGELEITDLNSNYLSTKSLDITLIGRGVSWFDVGEVESMLAASSYISTVQSNQKYRICVPEEIALRMGYIDMNNFDEYIKRLSPSSYKNYLKTVSEEIKEWGNDNQSLMKRLQT